MKYLIVLILLLSYSDRLFSKDLYEDYSSLKINALRKAKGLKTLESQLIKVENFVEVRSLCLAQLRRKEFPKYCYELLKFESTINTKLTKRSDQEKILDLNCKNFQFKMSQLNELKALTQNQSLSKKCVQILEKKYQVLLYQSEFERAEMVF